jgi:hypothetical protein
VFPQHRPLARLLVPNNANDLPTSDRNTRNFSLEDSTRNVPLQDRNRSGLLQSHRNQIASSIQRELTRVGPAGWEELEERQCPVYGRDGKYRHGVRRRGGVVEGQVATIRNNEGGAIGLSSVRDVE